jgi:hypothetical protein
MLFINIKFFCIKSLNTLIIGMKYILILLITYLLLDYILTYELVHLWIDLPNPCSVIAQCDNNIHDTNTHEPSTKKDPWYIEPKPKKIPDPNYRWYKFPSIYDFILT